MIGSNDRNERGSLAQAAGQLGRRRQGRCERGALAVSVAADWWLKLRPRKDQGKQDRRIPQQASRS